MSNHVLIHLETVLVSLQDRCKVCAKHTMAQKSFWTHLMVPLGDLGQVEARFGPFGDSANLDVGDVGDVGHVESHFLLLGDSVSVGAR